MAHYIKVSIVSFLVSLLSIYCYPQSCCSLSGFPNAFSVSIDNTAGAAQTNYAVRIEIDTQTPIGAGDMNVDGSDIRFLDDDCATPLDYFICGGINTTATEIWVLLPNLAAGATKDILLFYGNSGATAMSNQTAVFPNSYTHAGGALAGVQNYDFFEVPAGVTLNTTAGDILTINARKVLINGNINGDGL